MIGSVRGTIYKVAITVTALRIDPNKIVPIVSEEIARRLQITGTTTAQGLILWEAQDGNVVLQPIPNSVPSEVTVFVTSQIARSFV